MKLEGKRIIVTGAATGIGRATALEVAARGAIVAAFDVNDADGTTVVEAISAAGLPPEARGETLSLDDFARLTRELAPRDGEA